MPRFITPSNSPTNSPSRHAVGADADIVGRGVLRVGGGFSTDVSARHIIREAEDRAQLFRQQDGGMFNGALANYVDGRVRLAQEEHAFLVDRKRVDSVGVQYFENTSSSRPPVAWPQMYHGDDYSTQRHIGAVEDSFYLQQPTAFVAEDSMMSLDRPTASTMNKTRLAREHFHSGVNASSHLHRTLSPNRSRLHNTSHVSAATLRLQKTSSQPQLDRTLHSVDASCCNYNHPVQHKRVDGLFVTFCENNVETKLFNAVRDLDIEKNNRDTDSKVHRQELAAYLRQIEDLRKENDDLRSKLAASNTNHVEESSDLRTLKEQYENMYRERTSEWETLKKSFDTMNVTHQDLLATAGSRQHRIDELEKELRGAKTTQTLSDAQLREMGERMTAAIAHAAVAEDGRNRVETELRELKLLFTAKEQIMLGLQRSLRDAEDKISGIAILRDQVRNANRR
ncbi:Hypothetical protein, putative [Bodo saltans]|uniref:Uncharacterized protein n=1 Tax=Bodo saltans TaxID=75058 RepID=A0A0S4J5X9_BODSA|nr:Hypothetical protein, putative [Bodo saltans]|eukprot:CUG83951.1 Hypothetical protein, putative [Bodo saltans]